MPDTEYFDVVNEKDEVQKQETREKVHAQNLLHRAIHILVFNQSGEVFLQKRSLKKDLCPGLWGTSCAGHLNAGESYDKAAQREFKEELGISAPNLSPQFKLNACKETGFEFVWVYRCEAEGPFELNPEEIDDGRWVQVKDLNQEIKEAPDTLSPSLICVWQHYQKHLKKSTQQ